VETVRLKIPALPEYVGVVRLVAAGLAARLSFTFEDIEDLKIAVDELCAYLTGPQGRPGDLELAFKVSDRSIELVGTARLGDNQPVRGKLTELSRMILDTVTDEASLEAGDGLPTIRLLKRTRRE
jgi:serine/threonine-protein kinase RsbW